MGWPAAPLAAAYGLAVRVRNRLFDMGWRRAHRLPAPVLSVGNLTAGGTGKTPAVVWLARALIERGERPAVLLRGYGAAARGADGIPSTDEAVVLREALPDVAVVAEPDRVAGGRAALAAGATVLVCDDGFQHRRLARDLDLLCIDATDPAGGGHLLPWGLLREPVAGARRAHAALLTRSDAVPVDALAALRARGAGWLAGGPVLATTHAPRELVDAGGVHGLDALAGVAVFVLSGVGNPAAVAATAAAAGARVVGARAFPDHHAWTAGDLAACAAAARAAGAAHLLTTEKDWVKLRALPVPDLPLAALRIALAFTDDPAPLLALVDRALSARPTATARPPR